MAVYEQIITGAMRDGGLLDALLALQKAEGYVSEGALAALAEHVGVSDAALYDAASFYSMLRFEKPAQTEIRVCRGTACHSGGNAELVAALEKATGVKLGESNERYSLGWVECLGQCQAAPNVLINGELFTNVEIEKIPELLGGAKA
ncbi:MAG: NAD(P)H-dependent oxidoreductase subunit E [Oscillospiraceae bacterium]|nr:NAD(P)H-dependent oxidoreductase subunit E [Oscillospiraceae bacterium]